MTKKQKISKTAKGIIYICILITILLISMHSIKDALISSKDILSYIANGFVCTIIVIGSYFISILIIDKLDKMINEMDKVNSS